MFSTSSCAPGYRVRAHVYACATNVSSEHWRLHEEAGLLVLAKALCLLAFTGPAERDQLCTGNALL